MKKLIRGFRDVFDKDASQLTGLEVVARQIFKTYNYKEIRIPTVELKELFVKSTGDSTDIVQKEMYSFTDIKGRVMSLRPEGTPGTVRAYIENNFSQVAPVQKFYYIGNMFRSERPQAGRYREFEQIGAEFIGSNSPSIDAELIILLKDIVTSFGVKKYLIKINNLGCENCRPKFRKDLVTYFNSIKKTLCDNCKTRISKNPLRVLDCKIDGDKVKKSAPKLALCDCCKKDYNQVKALLKSSNIKFEDDSNLVRGLDYYSGTVFEFQAGSSAQNAIAGGGRYNSLVKNMGGADMPAAGWALGVERVILASEPKPAKKEKLFFVVSADEQYNTKCFEIAQNLRAEGINTDGGLFDKNIKQQMKESNRKNVDFVLILGEEEDKANKISLKDLKTGKQKLVSQKTLVKEVKKLI
ncbi:MAG: histidine--tRNA ligase [Elusimicrobiaceae bacterium]|jgi:histidyl-tRNA synthetase|nr:histidine--tRNA ligase [Elusimicrobiaceae bacterium]MBT4007658.1 histidine--tRNA ligase [Elusimicrobiaceae bacterium]MBT4403179.1 histidine--tRNA ligase [Elusimicrobiaceae bacterium]MBT4439565.1 histidine--tRNA ligase [Elusimicrobiaceae bacterium]MBT5986979.1 histidine--tRNA ligase [Elusimicrobiaceae bacterium]